MFYLYVIKGSSGKQYYVYIHIIIGSESCSTYKFCTWLSHVITWFFPSYIQGRGKKKHGTTGTTIIPGKYRRSMCLYELMEE